MTGLRSMTGLGIGAAALGEGRVVIELRALNHRHQDVRVRLPTTLSDHAFLVEQLARQRLGRGRYDIAARTEGAVAPPARLSLERAEGVFRALLELRDRLAPGSEVSVASVLALPDVLDAAGPDAESAKEALTLAFEEATLALLEMQRAEGQALARELTERLETLRHIRSELGRLAQGLTSEYRARLSARLARLLEDAKVTVESGRLEQEIALLADRSDITEELVRLGSHLDQLSALLQASEPVGRRLDFLLQEVGREINTVGSKAQHGALSELVVSAKAEVERLREQVQNVD